MSAPSILGWKIGQLETGDNIYLLKNMPCHESLSPSLYPSLLSSLLFSIFIFPFFLFPLFFFPLLFLFLLPLPIFLVEVREPFSHKPERDLRNSELSKPFHNYIYDLRYFLTVTESLLIQTINPATVASDR